MDGARRSLGPDGSLWQAVAACLAGWLAASATQADLDFIRQALGLIFNF